MDYKLKIEVDAAALEKALTNAFSGVSKDLAGIKDFTNNFKMAEGHTKEIKKTVTIIHDKSQKAMNFIEKMVKMNDKITKGTMKQTYEYKTMLELGNRSRQKEMKNLSLRNAIARAGGVTGGAGKNIGQMFGGRMGGAAGSALDIIMNQKKFYESKKKEIDPYFKKRLTQTLGPERAAKEVDRLEQEGAKQKKIPQMVKLAGIVAGLAGVAGLSKLIIDSSPLLKAMFKILNVGIMFMLRPIGDFIGFMLRPLLIEFVKKVAIPAYKKGSTIAKEWGTKFGDALLDFIKDPIGTIASAITLGLQGLCPFQPVNAEEGPCGPVVSVTDPWAEFLEDIGGFAETFLVLTLGPAEAAIRAIIGFFVGAQAAIDTWIGQAWIDLGNWFKGIGDDVGSFLTTAWENFSGWFIGLAAGINSFVGKAWLDFTKWLSDVGKDASGALTIVWEGIVWFFESIHDALKGIWDSMMWLYNKITGKGDDNKKLDSDQPYDDWKKGERKEETYEEWKRGGSQNKQEFNSGSCGKSWGEQITDILKGVTGFAKGGVVNSPTLAMIGECGPEVITPMDKFEEYREKYTANKSARDTMREYGNIYGKEGGMDSCNWDEKFKYGANETSPPEDIIKLSTKDSPMDKYNEYMKQGSNKSARENMKEYGNTYGMEGGMTGGCSWGEKFKYVTNEAKQTKEAAEDTKDEFECVVDLSEEIVDNFTGAASKIKTMMGKADSMMSNLMSAGAMATAGAAMGGDEGTEMMRQAVIKGGTGALHTGSNVHKNRNTGSLKAMKTENMTQLDRIGGQEYGSKSRMEEWMGGFKEEYKEKLKNYNETMAGGIKGQSSAGGRRKWSEMEAEMRTYNDIMKYALEKYSTVTGPGDACYDTIASHSKVHTIDWMGTRKRPRSYSGTYSEILRETAYAKKEYSYWSSPKPNMDYTRYMSAKQVSKRKYVALSGWLANNPKPDYNFANGGIINEPIFGLGKSGKTYGFGERGSETIIPGLDRATCMRYKGPFNSSGKAASWEDMKSGDYTFNITINGARNPSEFERFLRPIILKVMKESRARSGII